MRMMRACGSRDRSILHQSMRGEKVVGVFRLARHLGGGVDLSARGADD